MITAFETTLTHTVRGYLSSHHIPKNLSDSIEYSLFLPGKRIRPRLAISTGELLGISNTAFEAVAMALEMIHCFTLIHDDLPCMDNDDFRRGQPSNHRIHGEGMALLAGDALMPFAVEVFSRAAATTPASHFIEGLMRFMVAVGPKGVVGGQAAESLITQSSSLDDLLSMHRRKTGALFEAAILIPMDFKGISADSPPGKALSKFAAELGLAFQIADDLEDAGQPGEKELTSILHFMSPEAAAKRAISAIETSSQELEHEFGSPAQKLVAIAWEVLDRTRSYL